MTELLKQELGPNTFKIMVLWIQGWSIGSIAQVAKRTTGSIRGVVNRHLTKPRDEMTAQERSALLFHMKQNRLDDGVLDDRHFTPSPLTGAQAVKAVFEKSKPGPEKPAKPKPAAVSVRTKPMTLTEKKKQEARIKAEQERKLKLEREVKAERERGGATKRGADGAALETLYALHILSDDNERRIDHDAKTMPARDRRKEAGARVRGYIEACRVGGMSSVDFEREVSGGGAHIALSANRLTCLSELGALRKMVPARDFDMIEGVLDRDEFPWEKIPSKTGKRFLYESIRRTLDICAVFLGYWTPDLFRDRWGFDVKTPYMIDYDDAKEVSRKARKMFSEAARTTR